MGQILSGNFEGISYEIGDDAIIVCSKSGVKIGFDDSAEPTISIGEKKVSASRANMARLLWAAAYLIDSEQRWAEDEYPSQNYED